MAGTEKVSLGENWKVGKGGNLVSAVLWWCLRVCSKRGKTDGGKEATTKANR